MKKKLKVATILGTRPEIIRLSETIKAFDNDNDIKHILIHTGQNYDYELNQIFFDNFGLRAPDYYLSCASQNLGETIGNIVSKSYSLLKQIKPDCVVVLGDTNSILCTISARRLNITIFHLEAGNRCGDWNVPETVNRKIADQMSHYNLPYNDIAKKNLLLEGVDESSIYVTGSPMKEVLLKHHDEIEKSEILNQYDLREKEYFVFSMHREENITNPTKLNKLLSMIKNVSLKYNKKVFFSVHPRTAKILADNGITFDKNFILSKPIGFFDYIYLQKHSFCVLSDSGTLTEESAILNFPAVLLRDSTERWEGIYHKTIVFGCFDYGETIKAIKKELSYFNKGFNCPPEYQVEDFSKKVLNFVKLKKHEY